MKTSAPCRISFNDVSLKYALDYGGSNSLKETVLNLIYRKKNNLRPSILNALDGVSVEVNQGERVGIVGLNGSGKSTFLKAAAGILKPQIGVVDIVGNVQPLIEIGAGFNPEFSGRENIYLNGAMLGFNPEQIRQREREIIEFAELENFIDIPVKHYSSGMAVRLAFTIATIIQPEVLLMDEMLSAGDLSFIEKAKRRIEQILNKAKILILVSHDLNLISSITSRCLVMEKGKIIFDGETEKALEFYREKTLDKIENAKISEVPTTSNTDMNESVATSTPVKDVCINNEKQNQTYPPDSLIVFPIEFELTESFEEVYVNLTVSNRVGIQMLHFRNDFQGWRLKKANPGKYQIDISVPNFPLKSERYSVQARVVALGKFERYIVDSKAIHLTVSGEKPRDSIVVNNWKINGPLEVVNS